MNAALHDRAYLAALIAQLEEGLLERDSAVRLALLAALAGEHVLLIGPPGTAKSELARRLHRAFAGARYFERLLTRFSTPEELFGPLSLKALEHDRYERLVDGYLPTASVAFLDEVFKANSAILNALLTLLNEREFDNGSARVRAPLISVVGATNEVPAEEALMAFYDRFLVRVPVAGVSDEAFAALLTLDARPQAPALPIAPEALHEALAQRDRVALPDEVLAGLGALRGFCGSHGIVVSDRRWRQLVGLLRSAAYTEGRTAVDALDLWLVPYVVAAQPAQVATLHDWFVTEVAQAALQDAPWLTRAVEAFEKQLEIELSMPAEGGDDSAGKLALARSIGGAKDDGMLRIVSAALEETMRRRWSPVHVAARLAQVDEVAARAAQPLDGLRGALATLEGTLTGRVWLPPSLAATLLGNRRQTLAKLEALLARLTGVRDGFAALPVDETLAPAEPAPIAIGA
ncbi:AAA family ATPase [uncultured Piscinibacter sp.]|uniref:AAA family ATPase n=1 Tax=uncultured Piscinibacter sp. TaxID=1131835 RepID=UPI00260DCA73|nr:AAA family ATPase [uncultured Piscinibacter sp.]